MGRALRGLVLLVAMAAPLVAGAAQYPGWGDTGWAHTSRRECCSAAIAIANDYSAQACINSGGVPSAFRGGGQRGTCEVEWTQDDYSGGMIYRCYGEAAIWCR